MDPTPDSVRDATERQLERAATLRGCGFDREANLIEKIVSEYRQALRRHADELLTIRQAAAESGYSKDRLRQLVRQGKIRDHRPDGSEGRIHVRRGDLPRKPWADRAD